MKKIELLLFIFLCYISIAVAQNTTMGIAECQQMAQENYPLVKRYGLIEQTADFTVKNIEKGWLPQINASVQATLQSTVVTLPDALEQMLKSTGTDLRGVSHFQYRAGVDIQQMVYDGGRINAQQRIAKEQSEAQKAVNDVQLYALRERVNDLCFGVLLIDRRLLINEEMQRTIAANHDKLLKLLKGGVAMQCDVDALAAELATARQQHSDMEAQRTTFLKVLSLFIGQDVSAIVTPRPEKQNNNGVRPELRMFDSQLSLTYAKEDALKASLIPQVGLFAQGYYGYPSMDMFHDIMHRNPTLNGIIGVRASWNISAFYTNKNDCAKLSLERQAIENDREVFLFNQRLQRETEDESIVRYQKLMEEDDEICRLRRSVRQAAEAKLESGTIDASTLISEIARETQAGINRSLHEVEMMQHQYKRQIIIGK